MDHDNERPSSVFQTGQEELFEQNFMKNLETAKNGFADLSTAVDTTTASVSNLDQEASQTDFSDFINKIKDIIQDTNNAFADLRQNLIRKLDDINLEYQRKAADAETDYLRKVEDTNRKYAQQIQDIKNKQRQQDINDEAKYQLQLWELRMRFLMDLEDACMPQMPTNSQTYQAV